MAKMKVETIEEYLARGGTIKRYPAVMPEEQTEYIKSSSASLVQLMSLDDGAHYFSETKEKKVRKKAKDPMHGVDVSKLPPEIRKMFNL